MDKLKFGSFVWPNNPETLRIKSAKDLKMFGIPYTGRLVQDYGTAARTVTGEGEFYGKHALFYYFRLSGFLKSGTPQVLEIPDFTPFAAYLSELDFIGEPGPGTVKYSFTFTEDVFADSGCPEPPLATIAAVGGDTLQSIAAKLGMPYQRVVELNLRIDDPEYIEPATVVKLK